MEPKKYASQPWDPSECCTLVRLVENITITSLNLNRWVFCRRRRRFIHRNMVPSQHFATTMEALSHLRTCHPEMTIMAMETTNRSKLYSQIDFRQYYRNESVGDDAEKSLEKRRSEGVALILGNEVTGVDSDLLWRTNELTGTAIIDEIIELPTFGLKNSLNVAVCAPVVIFEILRQWLGEPQQTHDAC
jgi:tRNA(Leu) C34 or U34 (ribose-2'-O)-methylase TrmL